MQQRLQCNVGQCGKSSSPALRTRGAVLCFGAGPEGRSCKFYAELQLDREDMKTELDWVKKKKIDSNSQKYILICNFNQ